ncbi:MAG: hypothetical protein D6727_03340 [Gammaproteobacteria bacterium]|nr:MAG: hypothetical protein D6727_03340 [Gammaproteobacteria bacterium]
MPLAGRLRPALLSLCALVAGGCGTVDSLFQASDGAVRGGDAAEAPLPAKRWLLPADDDVVGELQLVKTREADTFVEVARSYGIGYDELRDANPGVDPWLPGEGTPVILPTRHVLPDAPREGIVLNIAAKRLFYFPPVDGDADGPRVVETYPIGIGREGWETPVGETTVVSKARDPVWFVPASIRREHAAAGDPLPPQVPPGPDNPLGHYVLGLGMPGYLIHGTNKPAGVGMRVSHGCVRLYPEDIESLFARIPIGTPVRIVDQPWLAGWQGTELLIEAHRPLDGDRAAAAAALRAQLERALARRGLQAGSVDRDAIETVTGQALGLPLVAGADRGDALRQARRVRNIIEHERLADRSAP